MLHFEGTIIILYIVIVIELDAEWPRKRPLSIQFNEFNIVNLNTMKDKLKKFRKFFSEVKLWEKLKSYARQAGVKTVYSALLLFYAYKRKDTPGWAKRIVLGTLGYFIAFVDMIPDLTPIVGYTDDIGILSFGLVTIAAYINDEVKSNAKNKLTDWFGEVPEIQLQEVDDKLQK